VLRGERAVLGYPVICQSKALGVVAVGADVPILGVVRLLERVTYACMAGRKHLLSLARCARGVQLHLHKLIHVLEHQHVRVQLHYAIILCQRERRELAPAVVEARVVCVILAQLWQQIGNILLRYAALLERLVSFWGECIRVERDERVLGAVLLQAVVERKEAAEVRRVRDESRPHWAVSGEPWSVCVRLPFFEPPAGASLLLGAADDAIVYVVCQ
jgi:hypothetical protein